MALDAVIVIRTPEKWRRQVKAEAAIRGMTVSGLVRAAVDYYLRTEEAAGLGGEAGPLQDNARIPDEPDAF